MGAMRKWTGAQGQIDAANENAVRQEEATRKAAAAQQQDLMQSAKAAADQQAMLAARSAVEEKASAAAATPLDVADVQLDKASVDSVATTRSKRKIAFGKNYTSGVSI